MNLRHNSYRLFTLGTMVLAGCSDGGGGGGVAATSISGSVQVFVSSGTVNEAEPNDTVETAHSLGQLAAGQVLTVLGQMSQADLIDGFRLEAPERVKVTVSLDFDAAGGNDFDMHVHDPVGGQFVEDFILTGAPEVGEFHAKGSFILALAAVVGEGGYTLRIEAESASSTIAEREPNDLSGDGQYLGELLVGDSMTLGGAGDSTTDVSDFFIVPCPEAVSMSLSLAFETGADYAINILDATGDIDFPDFVGTIDGGGNPETGTVEVPANTLVAIEVVAKSTPLSGLYELSLSGAAPVLAPNGGGAPGLGRFDRRGLAALDLEDRHLRRSLGSARFGDIRSEMVTGEVLVSAAPGQALGGLLQRRGCMELDRIPQGVRRLRFDIPAHLNEAERARYTLAFAHSLAARAEIAYAEPNGRRRVMKEPNDPNFNLQWHYPLMQLPEAWEITEGNSGVIVAVLDTGETQHPDLVNRQISGFDMIDDPANAADGDGRDSDPTDVGDGNGVTPSSFHGTHVAGTIGAESDNGLGVAGVNWDVSIMHVRVLGKQGGSDFDIANGILYAAGLPNASGELPPLPARVLNMSLGGPGQSQAMEDAIIDARNSGAVVFVAAGNENSNGTFTPASAEGAISVSAVDLNAQKAPYSNFHPTVKLAAPGGDTSVDKNGDGFQDGVLSTLVDDSGPTDEFIFAFYQGTSMACPHAAGLAALMLSVDPTLTPAQIENIMTSTATDLGAPGRDDVFGFGMVNALAAILAVQGGGSDTPVLGIATSTANFTGTDTTLDVQVFNVGGGKLEVGTLNVTTVTGGPWLSASAVASSSPSTDTSAIRLTVDRTGLADGAFQGAVQVQSNGGTGTIQVLLAVGGDGEGEDVDIFILAVDPETLETLGQSTINPTTTLEFAFPDLTPGSYLVVGGSDDDDDGFICGPGDRFCGGFPTLDELEVIELAQGQSRDTIDFVMADEFTGLSAGAGNAGGGFRLQP